MSWHLEQDFGDHLNRYVVREAGRVVADRLFADDAKLIAAAPKMAEMLKSINHSPCGGLHISAILKEAGVLE